MKKYIGEERRRENRALLSTSYLVNFQVNGSSYEALMMDLSKSGAGLRCKDPKVLPPINSDEEIQFTFNTPYGESVCTGKIIWIKEVDDFLYWGIQFVKLSENKKDPLRCLIDLSF